ncbi:hypothetical protein [Halosimplex marinum]|uniref:hypothetical protein n=1 Tax=Halosimplex marinum TaxID=3396620 RepID=UPI003F557B90
MPPIQPAKDPVQIPIWLQIKLERYAVECLTRSESRHSSLPDDNPDQRTYDDVVDEIREEMGKLLSFGGGRVVCKLPESVGGSTEYIAKIVGARERDKHESVPVSTGFVQNWREILLSRYEQIREYIVPVVSASPTGLWLVMPYAEQEIEWDRDRLNEIAEEVEAVDGVNPVMAGSMGGGLDIYWSENFGAYEGEYRLLDYGGIHLTATVPQSSEEFPFVDPRAIEEADTET